MTFAAVSQQAPGAQAPNGSIRVMIVDDSVVIRGLLSRWLGEVQGITVVASCRTGAVAVNEIVKAAPDVIILDIEMPDMDGITALPLLREKKPDVAVIMASTLSQRNAEMSLKALSLGAKDYIPKPEGNHGVTTSVEFRRDLIARVLAIGAAARGGVAPAPAARTDRPERASAPELQFALRPFSRIRPRILAIGSSTGGPQALQSVFAAITPSIGGLPVVLTQHMPGTFTAILAEHIAKASGRPCAEGSHGEPLMPGRIYVAPGGKHMHVVQEQGKSVVALSNDPPVNFCKPAVDPLFDSVAQVYGAAVLAVVLTGMGSDGARGAVNIANAGGSVIAQDEATSVVWGMPGSAAAAGACAAVLPLPQIGPKINAVVSGQPG